MTSGRHPASFRDPAGYVFRRDGLIYRKITSAGVDDYRRLMDTGLYESAVGKGLLLSHVEETSGESASADGITILPDQLSLISYPYEWSFSQLKDASLAVLDLQELALEKGMSLKDATAYNLQFVDGRPVFIDTSSFESYREGSVWVAYRQFCEHFLTPLLIMSKVDARCGRFLSTFIDGVPVDVAAKMVPRKTWLNPWLYMHVGLHGRAKKRGEGKETKEGQMPKSALLGLLKSLRQAIESLKWTEPKTEWNDYSSASSYDREAAQHKHELVAEYVSSLEETPSLVWDLGANAGEFSRITSSRGIPTVAWDGDPAAVERNYRAVRDGGEKCLLPLILDLTNPSPAIGWQHEERMSFINRGPADLVMALALIHHLVIGNSVPMDKVADFFVATGKHLIIEFVDPADPRVRQLVSTRSVTQEYSQSAFEAAFDGRFEILRRDEIRSSKRTLYLMKRRP